MAGQGTWEPEFAAVADAFADLATEQRLQAQLVIHHRGRKVVDLHTAGLAPDALVPVYSVGKGAIGTVIARLLNTDVLDVDAPVAKYWPEFAAGRKAAVTVRQVLTHQAGLVTVDGGLRDEDLIDHDGLAARLAAQAPMWQPGVGFGYHWLTIGTLADEIVRRCAGRTLAAVFSDLADRHGIDVHVGPPAALDGRVTTVETPTPEELRPYADRLARPRHLDWSTADRFPRPFWDRVNDVDVRRAGNPAVAAVASARGLARMYAALPEIAGPALADVRRLQCDGTDLTHGRYFRYGLVFQLPGAENLRFGSPYAVGHDGLGGALGWYDPVDELAFGYVPKRVWLPESATPPSIVLAELAHKCAADAVREA